MTTAHDYETGQTWICIDNGPEWLKEQFTRELQIATSEQVIAWANACTELAIKAGKPPLYSEIAIQLVIQWLDLRYPTFKRYSRVRS